MERTNRFEAMKQGHQILLAVALIIAFVLSLILLGEAAIRVRSYFKHGDAFFRVENISYIDEATGLRLPKPGYRSGKMTINEDGFRGPLIPHEKPEGTTRIAFVGGSTTLCAEVSGDDKTWPFLAMQALGDAYPDRAFDYVNAGVSGFTVASSLTRFKAQVAALKPDIVMVYHATNDLSRNSRVAAEAQGFDGLRGDQSLPWITDYSLLAYLVVKNLRVLDRQQDATDPVHDYRMDPETIAEPFADDLDTLIAAIREAGAKPVVATFATRIRAEQNEEEKLASAVTSLYYMPYMTPESLITGFDRYNRVIRDLDDVLMADIAEEIPGDAVHFVDSVHFTDEGAQAMADAVLSTLVEAVRRLDRDAPDQKNS